MNVHQEALEVDWVEMNVPREVPEENQGDRDKISSWMKARVTEIRSRPDEKTKTTREEYLRGSKPRPPARITSGGANQDLPRGLPPGRQTKTTREDYLRGSKPRPLARITSGGANQDHPRGIPPGEANRRGNPPSLRKGSRFQLRLKAQSRRMKIK